jgi:hypothetical protein
MTTKTKAEKVNLPAEVETNTALSLVEDDASFLAMLERDQSMGKGLEGVTAQDISIPFLSLIQNNSPQLDQHHPKYVKGATAGQVYNSVTHEAYDSIDVISIIFNKKLVEWSPRSGGSSAAPVAEHDVNSPIRDTATLTDRRLFLPNGNQLVETAYRYVIFGEPGSGKLLGRGVMSLDSSDLTSSKKWNFMLLSKTIEVGDKSIKLPAMGQVYKASGEYAKNDAGSWYKWKFEFDRRATKQEYIEANQFYDGVAAGIFKPEPIVADVDVSEPKEAIY